MITTRAIVRGALTRTLPATWLGIGAVAAAATRSGSHVPLANLMMGLLEGLPVAVGSTLALIGIRKWLRDDAGVDGRRAVIVGLGGVALTITAVPFLSMNIVGEYVLTGAAGAVVAVAVFFPWLQSRQQAAMAGASPVGLLDQETLVAGLSSQEPAAARESAT